MNENIFEKKQYWDEVQKKPSKYFSGYMPISKFPFIYRDITTTLDNKDFFLTIFRNSFVSKYLRTLRKIDEYKPKNNTTHQIVFQSYYRTLTNREVDECMLELEKSCNNK
jgi:phenylalanyl-tRNA synthetase beta subunit